MNRAVVVNLVTAVAWCPIMVYAGHGAAPAIAVLVLGLGEYHYVIIPGGMGLVACILAAVRRGRPPIGPLMLLVSFLGLMVMTELRLRTALTAIPFLAAVYWSIAESSRDREQD